MGCRLKENPEGLFVAFFEVAAPVDKKSAPQIVSQFPDDFVDIGVTKELPKFCFPCDLSRYNPAGQHFTFVLTGLDNKQRFGFCRHPPGAKTCLCILSYLPWFEIFYKILNQIAELKHHDNNDVADQLILKLFEAEVPNAYTQCQISIAGDVPVEMKFAGPDSKALPRIPDNRNMVEYFSAVNPLNMMTLFASLLNERRVLVTSEKLSRLAAIVHGSASLLYPLYWQHIYIPVMPAHLIDYCCAPMPFFVGVHSSFMPQVRKMALDEVVILNADTNKIETPFDDLQAFPPEAVSELKKNLKNENLFYGDGVARSFLKTLVYLLGGYREAVRIKTGTEIGFDQEVFVQCRSRNMQPFLEKLLQLQHFTQFIDARVQLIKSGMPINDLFEEELEIAKQDGSLSSKNLKETLRMHLISARTDGKKMFKDAQKKMIQAHGSIRPKANPAAMKQKLKETRDFANKQLSGMKTKLIKGKETEDLDLQSKTNHRHTTYLDISLPLPASSAPTSPSVSPNQSPLSIRSLDVRRKTTSVKSSEGYSSRPMTMAGIPIPNRQLSDDASPRLPPKSKTRSYQSFDPSALEASTQEEDPPSDMNLLDDLQEVLQSISTGQIPSAKERKLSADDTPVPMPRRKKVERPLIPPPPIPPRRERRMGPTSNETLIDISNGDRTQIHGDGSTVVQNPLGVDCEDNTLAFQSVHVNNNAGMSYMQEEIPRNTSATTLLSDYGLNFGVPLSVDQERAPSSTHNLCVPGLRATSSSPNLESYTSSRNPSQQVLVEQPPASTLPDLLCPANTLPRQTMNLVPVSSGQERLLAKQTLGQYQVHSHIQQVPLQPAAAAENPFQAAAGSKDPFADLVSIQRQGVTSPTWKK
ncbi:DENN domain-containing protein 1B-like isoform X2 [Asterias rubens]|uniref:DENN domain-containing protein 1B-like isoform X2 n=1 Tax=Asterias rubens TaxID=7604 RepID=UPI001455A158|nr:DENN domain-containing protein 1B-like isoform X2 [Asterias rubens]